jgi:hypothetical protein
MVESRILSLVEPDLHATLGPFGVPQPGNLDGYQKKRFARKAIRKNMKQRARQGGQAQTRPGAEADAHGRVVTAKIQDGARQNVLRA